MGREVKRVPMDFDWPIGKIWSGYDIPDNYGDESDYRTDPPTGEGWQFWSTTDDGSPLSPVCSTAAALAWWLAENSATSFADITHPHDWWREWIEANAPAPLTPEELAAIKRKGELAEQFIETMRDIEAHAEALRLQCIEAACLALQRGVHNAGADLMVLAVQLRDAHPALTGW